MDFNDLRGKLVAVLGFGQEGRAVTNYLIKHGIKPVLFDERPWGEWPEQEKDYIRSLGVNFIFGLGYLEELKGFDVAFRSPGIPLSRLTINNLRLTSQTKWFFEHCPAMIIGVTGTKGKGTTASLIYEILKKQCQVSNVKCQMYLTGNIGKIQPMEFLDGLKPEDWVVYELSSFQLQDLDKSPHIGVVLMATSEHLDYHRDDEEYITAKSAIVKYQSSDGYAVINADFKNSIKIGEQGKGQKYYFSRIKEVERGCFIDHDQLVVKDINGNNFKFQISNVKLKGKHNLENICAAVTTSILAGVNGNIIQSVIDGFKGLEHRLEFVAEKGGIKFYNDSFSTTPETAVAAIEAFQEPEILILGGSSKNSDFTELGKVIAAKKNIKAIILIGQEADRIKQEIDSRFPPSPRLRGAGRGNDNIKVLEGAKSMAEIFDQIKSVTEPGDVVILSPACASFGMFKNYKDRGEQFKTAVNDW